MSKPAPPPVHYAGFWRRFVAFLIDSTILCVVAFFFLIPALGFLGLGIGAGALAEDPDAAAGLIVAAIAAYFFAIVIIAIAGWLYYAIMESSAKQGTLGKMALGIVVTDMDGKRISFGRATGRYFGKILSGMILYIGYIMAGFTQKKQALHDILASCLVVMR
ncbi:MAG TPA: RDD family protein [Bacteroidetes bacterium]|nr:RDD family protein [Bacteroidota bacterium]